MANQGLYVRPKPPGSTLSDEEHMRSELNRIKACEIKIRCTSSDSAGLQPRSLFASAPTPQAFHLRPPAPIRTPFGNSLNNQPVFGSAVTSNNCLHPFLTNLHNDVFALANLSSSGNGLDSTTNGNSSYPHQAFNAASTSQTNSRDIYSGDMNVSAEQRHEHLFGKLGKCWSG